MHKYTNYCTEEQTRKALELGAPIKATFLDVDNKFEYEGCHILIPTTEQMIGWLRNEKRISISVSWMPNVKMYNCICSNMDYTPKEHSYKDAYKMYKEHFEVINKDDNSYKFETFEAALSAGIDKALEYIENNKK